VSALSGRLAKQTITGNTYTSGNGATEMTNCKQNSFSKDSNGNYLFISGCAYKCLDDADFYKGNALKSAGSFTDITDLSAVCYNDDVSGS